MVPEESLALFESPRSSNEHHYTSGNPVEHAPDSVVATYSWQSSGLPLPNTGVRITVKSVLLMCCCDNALIY